MRYEKQRLLHRELTEKIIKVFFEVYNELGFGFLESVYEEGMKIALTDAGLSVDQQVPLSVWFRDHKIGDFRADLIVEGLVIIELKAAGALTSVNEAQLLNYLRATRIEVGLLMNFGRNPQFKRFVFENNRTK